MPLTEKPKVGGHRPDPPNSPVYKCYETDLKPRQGLSAPAGATSVDWRPYTSPRHDQRQTNTCTAQSTVKACEIKLIMKWGRAAFKPLSVLQPYYGGRELMLPQETNVDNGCFISNIAQVGMDTGICLDSDWPFMEANLYTNPGWDNMRSAFTHKIAGAYKIQSEGAQRVDEVRSALLAGNIVIFGTLVGQDWFNYNGTGVLGIETHPEGGHATCLVGFREDGAFIDENSWGTEAGDNGFFYLDPSVIADPHANDFVVITAPWEES